ncbi:hypothetical protein SUGI_0909600 [Cryptomeria japonica]|nr:hypothetical protein SUGI_0909600 [Cryptomeria japonica]
MATALNRSDISFRRQGSSGIVWDVGSIPGKADCPLSDSSILNSRKNSSSDAQPPFLHSKSTGSIGTGGTSPSTFVKPGQGTSSTFVKPGQGTSTPTSPKSGSCFSGLFRCFSKSG